jgi:hypothetical protein
MISLLRYEHIILIHIFELHSSFYVLFCAYWWVTWDERDLCTWFEVYDVSVTAQWFKPSQMAHFGFKCKKQCCCLCKILDPDDMMMLWCMPTVPKFGQKCPALCSWASRSWCIDVRLQCPSGMFSTTGASVCTSCSAGKYLTNATGGTVEVACTNVSGFAYVFHLLIYIYIWMNAPNYEKWLDTSLAAEESVCMPHIHTKCRLVY